MPIVVVTRESPPAQREALAPLLLDCIRHNRAGSLATLETVRRFLDETLERHPNTSFWTLLAPSGEAVGVLHAALMPGLGGSWLWLQDFFVRKAARGAGLGSELGSALERWILEAGVTHMAAQTSERNAAVLALAKRFKLKPRKVTWLERDFPRRPS